MTRSRLTIASLIATLSVVAATTAACSNGNKIKPGPTLPPPSQDAFYKAPKNLASLHPGDVIRSKPVTIPGIDTSKVADAETVLFVSTDVHNHNIAASETLLTPTAPWSKTPSRPLLAWQQTYDSLSVACEPSYTLRIGGAGAPATVKTLNNLLPTGAEIVLPDYEGPDALFAIGDQQGRIVLDGIRAAESTHAGGMSKHTRVVTWGYSGGGLATAWGAELQPSYAPKVNLVGAAEGGVPADLKSSLELLNGGQYAFLAIMSLVAIDHAYPQAGLGGLLNAAGNTLLANFGATCGNTAVQTQYAGTKLDTLATVPDLLNAPTLQSTFAALKLGKHPPTAAIYNYQGTADDVVGFDPDRSLVQYYCSNGVTVDFVPVQGANHTDAYFTGTAGVANWLLDRLDGKPAPSNCGT